MCLGACVRVRVLPQVLVTQMALQLLSTQPMQQAFSQQQQLATLHNQTP